MPRDRWHFKLHPQHTFLFLELNLSSQGYTDLLKKRIECVIAYICKGLRKSLAPTKLRLPQLQGKKNPSERRKFIWSSPSEFVGPPRDSFFVLWKVRRRILAHQLRNILLLIPGWKKVRLLFFCRKKPPLLSGCLKCLSRRMAEKDTNLKR